MKPFSRFVRLTSEDEFTQASKGFTLIELLVVIAIIGLLAGIIIATLGLARAKGVDAAIKGSMHSVNAQMELFASTATSYNGGCAASATTTPQGAFSNLSAAASQAGSEITGGVSVQEDAAGAYNKVTCNDNANTWAAESPLSASTLGTPKMWCIDSSGAARQESVPLATAATFACL